MPDDQEKTMADISQRLAKQDEAFQLARDKLYKRLDEHE